MQTNSSASRRRYHSTSPAREAFTYCSLSCSSSSSGVMASSAQEWEASAGHRRIPVGEESPRILFPRPDVEIPELELVTLPERLAEDPGRFRFGGRSEEHTSEL